MEDEHHWYDRVSGGKLRQGDLFCDQTIYWLPEDLQLQTDGHDGAQTAALHASRGCWIVLNPSCDLDQQRCSQVVVAQVLVASRENLRVKTDKELAQRLECLRRGHYPARFLLAAYDASLPLSFVDFVSSRTIPRRWLETVTETHFRLKAPFREQFGNWVGSCFSRVGPEDHLLIPPFVDKLHDAHRLNATNVDER